MVHSLLPKDNLYKNIFDFTTAGEWDCVTYRKRRILIKSGHQRGIWATANCKAQCGHFNNVFLYEPQHEFSNNVVYATSKASDQPAHTRSLIRAFASRLNIL